MNELTIMDTPSIYPQIEERTKAAGFSMSSDKCVGSLLKTLIASKPSGRFLEIGTGTGLSLSWILDGMDVESEIITIDNDPNLIKIASEAFAGDRRVELICTDGESWIKHYKGEKFDLIFADAWPGKYYVVEETLELLRKGGFYIIDDMLPQPGWPDGHQEKAEALIDYLERRKDLHLTKMNWATGIIIATKI